MNIDWGSVVTQLLLVTIPILIPLLLTIPAVVKWFKNKARRDMARTILTIANSIVEKYAAQGKSWAQVLDAALDELIKQLEGMGVAPAKAQEIAERELARAKRASDLWEKSVTHVKA